MKNHFFIFGLVCGVLFGCQRLSLDRNSLVLDCGQDVAQSVGIEWLEVMANDRKAGASGLEARVIDSNFQQQQLSISSLGCVGLPIQDIKGEWLAISIDRTDRFGLLIPMRQALKQRRIYLPRLELNRPNFTCPTSSGLEVLVIKDEFKARVGGIRDETSIRIRVSSEVKSGQRESLPILNVGLTEGPAFQLSLAAMPEGSAELQIEVFDLLQRGQEFKPIDKTCRIQVDRTPPRVQLEAEKLPVIDLGILQVQPEQQIELGVKDQTNIRIYSCLQRQGETPSSETCSPFLESGTKVKSPVEGVWRLYAYAEDAAGNRSEILQTYLSVFNTDRVAKIRTEMLNAQLLAQQGSILESLVRATTAFESGKKLPTATERKVLKDLTLPVYLQAALITLPIGKVTFQDDVISSLHWNEILGDSMVVIVKNRSENIAQDAYLVGADGLIQAKIKALPRDPTQRRSDNLYVGRDQILKMNTDGLFEFFDFRLKPMKSVKLQHDFTGCTLGADLGSFYVLIMCPSKYIYYNFGKLGIQELDRAAGVSYFAKHDVIGVVDSEKRVLRLIFKDGETTLGLGEDEMVQDLNAFDEGRVYCVTTSISTILGGEKRYVQCKDFDSQVRVEKTEVKSAAISRYGQSLAFITDIELAIYDFGSNRKARHPFFFNSRVKRVSEEALVVVGDSQTDGVFGIESPNLLYGRAAAENDEGLRRFPKGLYSFVRTFQERLAGTIIDQPIYKMPNFTPNFIFFPSNPDEISIFSVRNPLRSTYSNSISASRVTTSLNGDIIYLISNYPEAVTRVNAVAYWRESSKLVFDSSKEPEALFFASDRYFGDRIIRGDPEGLKIYSIKKSGSEESQIVNFDQEPVGGNFISKEYLATIDRGDQLKIFKFPSMKEVFQLNLKPGFTDGEKVSVVPSPKGDVFLVSGGRGGGQIYLISVDDWDTIDMIDVQAEGFDPSPEYLDTVEFDESGRLLLLGFHYKKIFGMRLSPDRKRVELKQFLKDHEDTVIRVGFLEGRSTGYSVSREGTINLHSFGDKEVTTQRIGGLSYAEAVAAFARTEWFLTQDGPLRVLDFKGRPSFRALTPKTYLDIQVKGDRVFFLDGEELMEFRLDEGALAKIVCGSILRESLAAILDKQALPTNCFVGE